jgi:polysaccharide biosynthesis protein PslH
VQCSIPAPPTSFEVMDILYLSHCVPNPPDKGEKIRAHHFLMHLARNYRVHLAAFARTPRDIEAARELETCCASVYTEVLPPGKALARSAVQFGLGRCATTSFYRTASMAAYADALSKRVSLSATVAFSTAMAPYAPQNVPLILDMADVDSEKWVQYGRMRRFGRLYRIEGRRLREQETKFAKIARCTFLATDAERALLNTFAPEARTATIGNGVDLDYFHPARSPQLPDLNGRKYIVFIGVMNYFPNVDAVCEFASTVLEPLRHSDPGLEFLIVGRDPSRRVLRLHGRNGIVATGGVPDVRPYLAGARAVVAPLRLARGIQNKVLEALAMGKPVLASEDICRTFGANLPEGVVPCPSIAAYAESYALHKVEAGWNQTIRNHAERQFRWDRQMARMSDVLQPATLCP